MFVLKLTDPKSPKPYGVGYITAGDIFSCGDKGFFLEEYTFPDEASAEEHITTCLSSGLYRPDITRDSFEVVEVKKYPDKDPYFCYTKECYEDYLARKAFEPDEETKAIVEAILATRPQK